MNTVHWTVVCQLVANLFEKQNCHEITKKYLGGVSWLWSLPSSSSWSLPWWLSKCDHLFTLAIRERRIFRIAPVDAPSEVLKKHNALPFFRIFQNLLCSYIICPTPLCLTFTETTVGFRHPTSFYMSFLSELQRCKQHKEEKEKAKVVHDLLES